MSENISSVSSLEPRFDCWIKIDGRRLPQYGEQTNHNGESISTSCWIASEPGKTFSVHGCFPAKVHAISDVFINGVLVRSGIHIEPSNGWELESTNDGSTRKKFEFSTLSLADSGDSTSGVKEEFGTIQIDYQRIKDVKDGTCDVDIYDLKALAAPPTVDEAAKQIGLHSVSLQDDGPVNNSPVQLYACTLIDEKPWRSFLFKYRPLDYLQAEGIAPPSLMRPNPTHQDPHGDQTEVELLLGTGSTKHEDSEESLEMQNLWQREFQGLEDKYNKERQDWEAQLERREQERVERFESEAREQANRWEREVHRIEKERQEREDRLERERREREDRLERERREREDRLETERREREDRYRKDMQEREAASLKDKQERERQYAKEKQEREEKFWKDRQKRKESWESQLGTSHKRARKSNVGRMEKSVTVTLESTVDGPREVIEID